MPIARPPPRQRRRGGRKSTTTKPPANLSLNHHPRTSRVRGAGLGRRRGSSRPGELCRRALTRTPGPARPLLPTPPGPVWGPAPGQGCGVRMTGLVGAPPRRIGAPPSGPHRGAWRSARPPPHTHSPPHAKTTCIKIGELDGGRLQSTAPSAWFGSGGRSAPLAAGPRLGDRAPRLL